MYTRKPISYPKGAARLVPKSSVFATLNFLLFCRPWHGLCLTVIINLAESWKPRVVILVLRYRVCRPISCFLLGKRQADGEIDSCGEKNDKVEDSHGEGSELRVVC